MILEFLVLGRFLFIVSLCSEAFLYLWADESCALMSNFHLNIVDAVTPWRPYAFVYLVHVDSSVVIRFIIRYCFDESECTHCEKH